MNKWPNIITFVISIVKNGWILAVAELEGGHNGFASGTIIGCTVVAE